MASSDEDIHLPEAERTRELARSLHADERLLDYLPELLADLWELGFSSEPVIALLGRHDLVRRTDVSMLDLGCGKGALLIQLAERFGWRGRGVDLMPEFVADARRIAEQRLVSHLVRFEVGDMSEFLERAEPAFLVHFGYDSAALGTLDQALVRLCRVVESLGFILLETAWTRPEFPRPGWMTEVESLRAVAAADLHVVDRVVMPREWVAAQNAAIHSRIEARTASLTLRRPDLACPIANFVSSQRDECDVLENQAECAILLLAKP